MTLDVVRLIESSFKRSNNNQTLQTITKHQSFGRKKLTGPYSKVTYKKTNDDYKRPKSVQVWILLCLVCFVPFEAESFVIVVHLKSDWSSQAPVDVEQPLEDERSIFLHTRAATHAETDNNHQAKGISCWLPATVAPCQVYVQVQALTAATGQNLSWWRNSH